MPANNIDLFTVTMRTEFINTYGSVADPTPLDKVLQVIPSTTKVENYSHLYPAPGVAEFAGSRRFVRIGESSYRVANKTYDSSFSVKLEDIEDDQVGGYKLKSTELAMKVKNWPKMAGLIALANGGTDLCFDGTAFFADSHTIGTGDNNIAFTAAGNNDSATHYIYALYTGGPIKPLFWQDRTAAKLYTDAGTESSQKAREVRYWADLRGAMGYGYWYDAIRVTITNTPTVGDMVNLYGQILKTFRGFKLPKSFTAARDEYLHQMHDFNSGNFVLLCSSGVGHIVENLQTQSTYVERSPMSGTQLAAGQSDNPYKGKFSCYTAGLLDSINI